MTVDRRTLLSWLGSTVVVGVSSSPSIALAGDSELALVVGMKSSVSGLSYHELKQLYLGNRLKSPSGEWLVPLNRQSNSAERIGFDDSVLGMSPEVVKQYWIDRRIRGQSGPPKAIPNSALILRLVNKVPGAIGYVSADEARGVKVVKIDGKRPGESGYGIYY